MQIADEVAYVNLTSLSASGPVYSL